jgi:ParB-like chromosome segregation protein Spo0J
MVQIRIENIVVPKGRRPLDQAKVEEIAASIKVVGLISPIGIRYRAGSSPGEPSIPELVFGGHRLAACRMLGAKIIEAVDVGTLTLFAGPDHDRLVEIAENLHRSELTTPQRDQFLAEWVALVRKRDAEFGDRRQVPGKPGPKPSAAIAEVAKASGIGLKTVKEAVAASKVSPAVKAAADRAELSQKQRLAISRLATEAEQLAAIEATYNRNFAPPDTRAPTDASKYAEIAEHRATFDQFEAFLKVFAALEARGDPAQVAEAILLLNVDEDPVTRLRRAVAFATEVANIVSGKSKSKSIAAAGVN